MLTIEEIKQMPDGSIIVDQFNSEWVKHADGLESELGSRFDWNNLWELYEFKAK